MEKLTCAQAGQIDLVEYLASLGHLPQKIRNQNYWFLSPLREEKTPSFKVNRERQIWFDHGSGKGGDLIDFGKLYFKCSTTDLLYRLTAYPSQNIFPFHPPLTAPASAGEKKGQPDGQGSKILITGTRPLSDKKLLDYLIERNIPVYIAGLYCKEVDFVLYDKKYTAIGFPNSAGGYELRSPDFKGSSAPKAITIVEHNSFELNVFEGFFDYLSYLAIQSKSINHKLPNFLVLNSTAFFEKSRQLMEQHDRINLYLNRDKTGIHCTALALQWDKAKFKDQSGFYKSHKDLNDWLTGKQESKRKGQRLRGGF